MRHQQKLFQNTARKKKNTARYLLFERWRQILDFLFLFFLLLLSLLCRFDLFKAIIDHDYVYAVFLT